MRFSTRLKQFVYWKDRRP